MKTAEALGIELDGLYLAAMVAARQGAAPADAMADVLDELGLTREAVQAYLEEHREDLEKTLEWSGI